MIKRLRRRFIAAAMAATFAVLFVMIGGMNLLNFYHLVEDADRLTHLVADHDGHFETQKPQDEPDDRKQPPQKNRRLCLQIKKMQIREIQIKQRRIGVWAAEK